MIVDETCIDGIRGLSIFDPFTNFTEHLVLLEVEVAPDDFLETWRRVVYGIYDGKLDVAVPHDVGIAFVLPFTLRCSSLVLVTWLVKVDFVAHDYGLD